MLGNIELRALYVSIEKLSTHEPCQAQFHNKVMDFEPLFGTSSSHRVFDTHAKGKNLVRLPQPISFSIDWF